MKIFDNLASLGKDYAAIIAIINTFVAVIVVAFAQMMPDENAKYWARVGALVMVAFSWLMYYLAQHYRLAAILSGIFLIISIIGAIYTFIVGKKEK